MLILNSDNIYRIYKMQQEIEQLVSEYGWDGDQISLQSPDGNFHTGNGKIEWSSGLSEEDFVEINTPDDWELTKFLKQENLYRTRIMNLQQKRCYTWHQDRSPRVHLAVKTHPACMMIVEDSVFHIPADGRPYWVDTRKFHTALNAMPWPKGLDKDAELSFERYHLVGCIKNV